MTTQYHLFSILDPVSKLSYAASTVSLNERLVVEGEVDLLLLNAQDCRKYGGEVARADTAIQLGVLDLVVAQGVHVALGVDLFDSQSWTKAASCLPFGLVPSVAVESNPGSSVLMDSKCYDCLQLDES